MKNKQRGVTLIVLVITIILLLILAGVTIGSMTSEKNIVQQAQESGTAAQKRSIIEKIEAELYTERVKKGRNLTKDEVEDFLEKSDTLRDYVKSFNKDTGIIETYNDYTIEIDEITGWKEAK